MIEVDQSEHPANRHRWLKQKYASVKIIPKEITCSFSFRPKNLEGNPREQGQCYTSLYISWYIFEVRHEKQQQGSYQRTSTITRNDLRLMMRVVMRKPCNMSFARTYFSRGLPVSSWTPRENDLLTTSRRMKWICCSPQAGSQDWFSLLSGRPFPMICQLYSTSCPVFSAFNMAAARVAILKARRPWARGWVILYLFFILFTFISL